MKALLLVLALVSGVSSAQAYGLSCGQLVSYKAELLANLKSIREQLKQTHDADKIEFYMDQYEETFSRLRNVEAAIESDCKRDAE